MGIGIFHNGCELTRCFNTTLKKARGEIWLKHSERRNNTKNYQDEDKKSAINKN